jgi:hypothetical protein
MSDHRSIEGRIIARRNAHSVDVVLARFLSTFGHRWRLLGESTQMAELYRVHFPNVCRIHYDLLCRARSDAVGLHTLEINRHSDVKSFILTQVHHSEARRRFRL